MTTSPAVQTENQREASTQSSLSQADGNFRGLIFLGALIVLGAVVAGFSGPPAPLGVQAPPAGFSAGRAMKHVAAISRNPHPVGTAEHDAVRDYIMTTLSQLGLTPQVQKAVGIYPYASGATAASVENITARLAGSGGGKAVLLVAHYDSVSTSRGAADDGAGVAALLEIARALRSLPQPRRDVLFLFTDGEEMGLLGAEAFAASDPWMQKTGVVLNMEARGTGGASIMFESSAQNGWLIERYGEAVSHPVANSLSYEIYRRLPNDTDFTVFSKAGLAGLNFAFIERLVHYHTLLDNAQDLSPASLQHQGQSVLEAAQALANSGAEYRKSGNLVYFDVLGLMLIRYPQGVALLLDALTAAALIGLLAVGARRRQFSPGRALIGLLVLLLAVLAAVAVPLLLSSGIGQLARAWTPIKAGILYHSGLYVAGIAALGLAAAVAVYALASRRISPADLTAGGMLGWLLLTLIASFMLPGTSYLFVWPLLFVVLGWWAVLLLRNASTAAGFLLLALAAAPAVILVGSMALNLASAFAFDAGAGVSLLLTLLLALFAFPLAPQEMPYRRLLPWSLAALGLVLCAIAAFTGFNREQPHFDSMVYGFNADTGKEVWASYDRLPDAWEGQFLTAAARSGTTAEVIPGGQRPVLLSPLALAASPLAAPAITVLEDRNEGGQRRLRLRIVSNRQAPVLMIYAGKGTPVRQAWVNGRQLNPAAAQPEGWGLQYYGVPPEGIELSLEVAASGHIEIKAGDVSYGLPAGIRPRPEDVIPAPARWNDVTVVTRSFVL